MRSAFVLAVALSALRYEVGDIKFAASRSGFAPEETKKLDDAITAIGYAESQLKSFRFVKSVSEPVQDLPEDKPQKAKK